MPDLTPPEATPTESDSRKIFVLDTSVILHDHQALHSFEEHDVAIPLTVLEELDRFKKGSSVLNRNAREFIRGLDQLSGDNLLQEWIPLNGDGSGKIRVLPPADAAETRTRVFSSSQPDHLILEAALQLRDVQRDRRVILVSKDINLRLKAKALELEAEDYKRVRIRDIAQLYRGRSRLDVERPADLDRLHSQGFLARHAVLEQAPPAHHFFILASDRRSALAWYRPAEDRLERIVKATAYGIEPRNAEQTFALHAILDPVVRLVTVTGPAGTGKTLLALAAALEQRRNFRQIYLARPIIPLSNRDIGYLPGDIHSKIDPYMQPLWDNLGFIKSQFRSTDKQHRRITGMVESKKLQIIPLAYIRGRTFSNVLFIVDEAQNLTPHEVKTIVTRAGEGAKIVLTGDIFQIDTPYLDSRSNGLSFVIDRLKGRSLYAHIDLEKGERSALANLASELL